MDRSILLAKFLNYLACMYVRVEYYLFIFNLIVAMYNN